MLSQSIGIVGAGAWGTALAKLLADKGAGLSLWCHSEASYRELTEYRENRSYLPGIHLPANIDVTPSLESVVAEKAIVICAVPSHAVREVFGEISGRVDRQTMLICGTKGIEEGSLFTMGELFEEIFGPERKSRHAFLSGPTFACEVARRLPAALTVAACDEAVARAAQESLSTPYLRVYTSTDVIGVQMGGVVKNVIAIAAGVSDGLGLGQNARAALITRGLAEMTRLTVLMGADPLTLAGLPGLGDLVLTCTGELSRNRKVGLEIAGGRSLQEIIRSTRSIAEGVRNTRSVCALARRLNVEMPIVEQMDQVLYAGKNPADAVRDLMQRSLKPELT
jgi:glycerol-3-phosphate dehydrogenase (NAD(P)+)